MENYRILDWDTEIFGFPVAKINCDGCQIDKYEKIFQELRSKKIRLAYWEFDHSKSDLISLAEKNNGFLTGKKVQYIKTLSKKNSKKFKIFQDIKIERYDKSEPNEALEKLIIQGAVYSRFFTDPMITKKQFEDLHKLWIKNSVKNNEIFILINDNAIAGFISLNEDENLADIDFITIDKNFRGKGYANQLLYFAHKWSLQHDFEQIKADTQKNNIVACKMYEKMKYHISEIKMFYHFWL